MQRAAILARGAAGVINTPQCAADALQVEDGQHDSRGAPAFVASELFWSFADGYKGAGGGGCGADAAKEQEDHAQRDGVYSE